ncbi:MAG: histone family protein [Candidatus Hodarchaeales archaeon]|jgi:histone H3/H4
MVDIPYSAVDRLIRKGGADRVASSAIHALQKELEEYGIKISQISTEFARHAGKKTIDSEDIALAIRKVKILS